MSNTGQHERGEKEVIFEATPLADHLDDAGLSDWSVDSIVSGPPMSTAERVRLLKCRGDKTVLLPLILTQGKGMRRDRFRFLLRRALWPRVSPEEDEQFLEKFRYVIVSSRLLEAEVVRSHSTLRVFSENAFEEDGQMRDNHVLRSDKGPWGLLKMKRRYWASGSSCLFVTVAILSWLVKQRSKAAAKDNQKEEGGSTAVTTTLCNVIIVFGISLYLFAHSRRRMLRMLRAKSIAYITRYVHGNLVLHGAISKCIALTQEVELLHNGYQPARDSSQAPFGFSPASRIEASRKSVRTGKALRASISATIYLASSTLLESLNDLIKHISPRDLERYFDIYEVDCEGNSLYIYENDNGKLTMRYDNPVVEANYYGVSGANATVSQLKYEFSRFHFLRRVFMCCLLSVSTNRDDVGQEVVAWTTVVDNLERNAELATQLARSLHKTRYPSEGEEDHISEQEQVKKSNTGDKSHLYNMALTLHHIETRLELLRSEGVTELEHNYNMIGNDIKLLLESWEAGKKKLQKADSDTLNTNSTMNDSGSYRSPDFGESSSVFSASTAYDDNASREHLRVKHEEPLVFEDVISENFIKQSSSPMSRSDRIALRKKAQAKEAEAQAKRDEVSNFVNELDSVLGHRRKAN